MYCNECYLKVDNYEHEFAIYNGHLVFHEECCPKVFDGIECDNHELKRNSELATPNGVTE